MKTLTNIGCLLIGWDKNILSECGEASHRQFRKLISALSIMLILWGTIGYCFADRYINLDSFLLKECDYLVFMFMNFQLEWDLKFLVKKEHSGYKLYQKKRKKIHKIRNI